jgi:hypothetical protein
MKISTDNYSDYKYRIKAGRLFIFHEPVNNAKKEHRINKHSFIVDWQIPSVDAEENNSLAPVDSINR